MMRTVFNPRAGAAATGLFLGGLAISAAVALVTAPLTPRLAVAETVANPNDQPSARTLPPGTGTVKRDGEAADRPTGSVSAPRRMKPSTEVTPSKGGDDRVNPLDHLSPTDRRGASN